jgi:hypothetical protein
LRRVCRRLQSRTRSRKLLGNLFELEHSRQKTSGVSPGRRSGASGRKSASVARS